jgi:hypothetical protein
MRRGERVAEKVRAAGTHEGREGLGACTRQARAAMSIVAVVEEWVCWAWTPTAGACQGRTAMKLMIVGRTATKLTIVGRTSADAH